MSGGFLSSRFLGENGGIAGDTAQFEGEPAGAAPSRGHSCIGPASELNFDDYDEDFSVGYRGFASAYEQMMEAVRSSSGNVAECVCLCGWVIASPATLSGFSIVPGVSVGLVLGLWVGHRLLREWRSLVAIVRWARRWIALERRGVRWVSRNGNTYRVRFYRKKDNVTLIDEKAYPARLSSEIGGIEGRLESLKSHLIELAVPVIGLVALVIGLALLHSLSVPHWVRDFHLYTSKPNPLDPDHPLFVAEAWPKIPHLDQVGRLFPFWYVASTVAGWWFVTRVLPRLVEIATTLFEEFVYRSGAQFIPGAMVHDAQPRVETLETMAREKIYGDMKIANPLHAAHQMAR